MPDLLPPPDGNRGCGGRSSSRRNPQRRRLSCDSTKTLPDIRTGTNGKCLPYPVPKTKIILLETDWCRCSTRFEQFCQAISYNESVEFPQVLLFCPIHTGLHNSYSLGYPLLRAFFAVVTSEHSEGRCRKCKVAAVSGDSFPPSDPDGSGIPALFNPGKGRRKTGFRPCSWARREWCITRRYYIID